MKRKIMTLALCLTVIGGLSLASFGNAAVVKKIPVKSSARRMMPKGKTAMMATAPTALTAGQAAQLKAGAGNHQPSKLTFDVVGGMFWYTPNEITVRQGDTVTVNFMSANGMHDFNLPDYGLKTRVVKAGESDRFTFTADKQGTFEYYCSVGNGYHRLKGQIGVLLVK